MDKDTFMEWVRETFDFPETTLRLMENILDYCEKLSEDEQYPALLDLFSGLTLSENEIRRICL